MRSWQTILFTVLGCDLVFALIAIPLARRKVPRNRIYGFRTPTTLANDLVWYESNAFFGRRLLAASVVSALAILALDRIGAPSEHIFILGSVAALVVPSLVVTAATFRYSRRVRSRNPPPAAPPA